MKLLFSEYKSDYTNYIFPYAIWALAEDGETPADFFSRGFLPASPEFERFYMCRHLRVALEHFRPSSENRRILRKGKGIGLELVPRNEFDYTPARRNFCKTYADIKFGDGVMTLERLDRLFSSPIVSHLLVFTEQTSGKEIGVVMLYLEPEKLAYYYYAFYDLNYQNRSLGMFMMTSALAHFAALGFEHIYLGSCYSKNALYKTQFAALEFFNGLEWSDKLAELKYLITRDSKSVTQHLLETDDFLDRFYPQGIAGFG